MAEQLNLLFYSKKCKTCENLEYKLRQENMLHMFIMKCVDEHTTKLPPQIHMVPTMIVKGINRPIEGIKTFEWIEQMKFLRRQHSNNIQRQITPNVQPVKITNEPLSYKKDEMGGISDIYTYVNNDPNNKSAYFQHNYFGYKDEDKNGIFTAPELSKMKKDDMVKMIKTHESERKLQDEKYTDVMKKQQIGAVMRLEKDNILKTEQGKNQIDMQKQRAMYMQQQQAHLQQLQMKQKQVQNMTNMH